VMLYMEFLLITAVAIMFSCLSNPIISCILTLALYVIGHLVWSLDLLKARLASGTAKAACTVLAYLLPNLAPFDIKGQVVHGVPVAPGALGFAAAYLVLYGGAVLAIACATFQRKELQ
jgi:Cu-processing system permease protein